jgi:hypothetical protein
MAFAAESATPVAACAIVFGTGAAPERFLRQRNQPHGRNQMGKGILLWLLGIPIPLIILFLLFWH